MRITTPCVSPPQTLPSLLSRPLLGDPSLATPLWPHMAYWWWPTSAWGIGGGPHPHGVSVVAHIRMGYRWWPTSVAPRLRSIARLPVSRPPFFPSSPRARARPLAPCTTPRTLTPAAVCRANTCQQVIVGVLSETGVFEFAAVKAYKFSGGRTWPLLTMLIMFSASSFPNTRLLCVAACVPCVAVSLSCCVALWCSTSFLWARNTRGCGNNDCNKASREF